MKEKKKVQTENQERIKTPFSEMVRKFKTINEQIQNIAQKKDTLCRRMYN